MALLGGRSWFAWLFLYGLTVNGPCAMVVALAQRMKPARTALVSGLLVGPTFAVGGALASATTPLLVDSLGQAPTMAFLGLALAASGLVAWFLPRERERKG